jgi:hypothetical protein
MPLQSSGFDDDDDDPLSLDAMTRQGAGGPQATGAVQGMHMGRRRPRSRWQRVLKRGKGYVWLQTDMLFIYLFIYFKSSLADRCFAMNPGQGVCCFFD